MYGAPGKIRPIGKHLVYVSHPAERFIIRGAASRAIQLFPVCEPGRPRVEQRGEKTRLAEIPVKSIGPVVTSVPSSVVQLGVVDIDFGIFIYLEAVFPQRKFVARIGKNDFPEIVAIFENIVFDDFQRRGVECLKGGTVKCHITDSFSGRFQRKGYQIFAF